jgi:6-phosphogluconolactonase
MFELHSKLRFFKSSIFCGLKKVVLGMNQKIKKFLLANCLFFLTVTMEAQQNNINLLVGTYTNRCPGEDMYVYSFNPDTGNSQLKSSIENVSNPSYLTLSADHRFVYCVNEDGNKSTISAFSFDEASGKLKFLNSQDAKGADPCYIINDSHNVIVANYSGGTIAVFPKNQDGTLLPAKQVVRHEGKSINKERQEKPHVHMVQFSPDGKFVLANDLGTDAIYVYSYNPDENEALQLNDKVAMKPGSGPRHLVFSPDGKFVFVLHELDGTLSSLTYKEGKLLKVSETSLVEKDFKGETGAADIHISTDGKFVYATNRGSANTISVFSADNGNLQHVETISSGGNGPRNFTISPDGRFVLVAHEKSGNIVVFKRDSKTGKLAITGEQIEVCAPVCLVFTE